MDEDNKKQLKDHYDKKWKSISFRKSGERFRYEFSMFHEKHEYEDVKIVLEYDGGHPEYGIYYGCERVDTTDYLQLKNEIWNKYKTRFFPDKNVKMEDVFLPNCENKANWLFWIRLDEHLTMVDALERLHILIQIFEENGFEEKIEDK